FDKMRERITQRTSELRQSELLYRTLADTVPEIIFIIGPNGRTEFGNRRWYEFVGLEPSNTAGPDWEDLVHPDDIERVLARLEEAEAIGSIFEAEYRLRRHDGISEWFLGRS